MPVQRLNMINEGSAQLLLFLGGTWAWLRLGLPANVYL